MIDKTTTPAWRAGRGPLAILPPLLFADRRAWLAILVGWVLAFGGSVLLGLAVTTAAPQGAGPDFGAAPAWVLLLGIALLSPVIETLLMGGIVELLLRIARPWAAVLASAAIWGVLHSLLAPLWGLVIWWPFLVFSTLYVTWRGRGYWTAVAVVSAVHILQNAAPAVATVLGY